MTSSKHKGDSYREKEWASKKNGLNAINRKYGFGSPESKAAWKAFIKKNRSF